MEHTSKNGKVFEIGQIYEYRGTKHYDIVIVMDWNNEDAPPIMVGFYFGEYDYETTEYYINIHDKKNSIGELAYMKKVTLWHRVKKNAEGTIIKSDFNHLEDGWVEGEFPLPKSNTFHNQKAWEKEFWTFEHKHITSDFVVS